MKSTQKFENFSNVQLFEKFMVVEILTSEDEHFRNATCNNVEKLCRKNNGGIFKPFS